jgi:hypothetical protein
MAEIRIPSHGTSCRIFLWTMCLSTELDFSLSIIVSPLLHAHSSIVRDMDEKHISGTNSTRTQYYHNIQVIINETLLSSCNYVWGHADGHTRVWGQRTSRNNVCRQFNYPYIYWRVGTVNMINLMLNFQSTLLLFHINLYTKIFNRLKCIFDWLFNV